MGWFIASLLRIPSFLAFSQVSVRAPSLSDINVFHMSKPVPRINIQIILPVLLIAGLHASTRVEVHHVLLVCVRQHFEVLGHSKGIIELARRFCVAVLDVPDFTVYPHVDACQRVCWVRLRRLTTVLREEG